jgi:hypothetical protein
MIFSRAVASLSEYVGSKIQCQTMAEAAKTIATASRAVRARASDRAGEERSRTPAHINGTAARYQTSAIEGKGVS